MVGFELSMACASSAMATILSGLADVPITLAVLTIGILLWVHYQQNPDPTLPAGANKVFPHFILTVMPAGIRGLVLAGVLATAMGSLSAAQLEKMRADIATHT